MLILFLIINQFLFLFFLHSNFQLFYYLIKVHAEYHYFDRSVILSMDLNWSVLLGIFQGLLFLLLFQNILL